MNQTALTPKQKRFVEEYLVDLNATQAAIRAGYSNETARAIGCENLTKPDIQNAVQAAMAERLERTRVTQDYVINNIKETVERCLREEFDPANALRGCELLGRHLKLFTDKVEHSVPGGLAERLAAARKRTRGE